MKIFIIDDEEVSLFIAKRLLALKGLAEDIHIFLSAEEALCFIQEGMEEEIPDVILLDLNMPVMNGWQFLDALEGKWAMGMNKCSIFILTSSLDYFDGVRAKEHPMVSGLIFKPLSNESLNLVVAQKDCL